MIRILEYIKTVKVSFKFKVMYTTVDNLQVLRFGQNDILLLPEEERKLKEKLARGLSLGNLFKSHVNIDFLNSEKRKMKIKATIWAVTEKYVVLKKGVTIPIDSVVDIN